jgi:hypothetical protein
VTSAYPGTAPLEENIMAITSLPKLMDEMPVLLEVDAITGWLDSNWPHLLSADDFGGLSARAGRNHSPRLLMELWYRTRLDDDALPYAVCDAWESAEWPLRCLDTDTWRELWEEAGYVENGRPSRRPDRPLTLYRGGHPVGWSWTDHLEAAQFFADRGHQRHPYVYKAVVEPGLLYARIHDPKMGRGEHEYVLPGHLVRSIRLEGDRRTQQP